MCAYTFIDLCMYIYKYIKVDAYILYTCMHTYLYTVKYLKISKYGSIYINW